eukprot:Awhi_evm1s7688
MQQRPDATWFLLSSFREDLQEFANQIQQQQQQPQQQQQQSFGKEIFDYRPPILDFQCKIDEILAN